MDSSNCKSQFFSEFKVHV